MERQVYTLGESLIDIIFENGHPLNAMPGGSMLNTAVSLGRTGIKANYLSEFGNDPAGGIIADFLENNNVNSSYCYRYKNHKTSIALAFLDAEKNAGYTFYHDYPDSLQGIQIPGFRPVDILLFGSFYSIRSLRRQEVMKFLNAGRNSGSLIIYDPNIRKAHQGKDSEHLETIIENFKFADIVKGSDEDFISIFGTDNPSEIYSRLSQYCPFLFITRGSEDVILMTPQFSAVYSIPEIDPISTIGAGDNFNAGLVYGLIKEGVNRSNMPELLRETWDSVSGYGIGFARACCLSLENYVPEGYKPV
jgi:fructokinase